MLKKKGVLYENKKDSSQWVQFPKDNPKSSFSLGEQNVNTQAQLHKNSAIEEYGTTDNPFVEKKANVHVTSSVATSALDDSIIDENDENVKQDNDPSIYFRYSLSEDMSAEGNKDARDNLDNIIDGLYTVHHIHY